MGSHSDQPIMGPFIRKPQKEQVTSQKISIIVLIQEYCSMKKVENSTFSDDSNMDIKFSEKEKRNFMITILQLLQMSDISLKDLCKKIKDKMKPMLYTLFLKKLQEFIDEDVGAIKDYFQHITFLLVPDNNDQPTITKSSVLGLFIRRMILAFEKLSFSQMTDLYTKFKHYYESANLQMNGYEESQDFGGSLTDSVMSLSGVRFSRMGRSLDPFQQTSDRKLTENSQRQTEYFILQQVCLLQHNQKEALSPTDLQDKIMEMLKSNPDIAEAHFLSYMNCLRVKEYCTAVHNSFHYFDRKTGFSVNSEPKANNQNKPKEEEVHRRYAALNLAALHYRFGHK
ncbi:Anaphase-promoting complex subunit 5 [Mactra antiquata]